MLTYTVTESDHCRRAESFLQNLLPAAPLSYLRKIIKSGHMTVNGEAVTSTEETLCLGDAVSLKETGRLRSMVAGRPPSLDILFEDQWIIAFNKEPGVAVHRAAEVDERNLVDLAQLFLRRRDHLPPGSPMKLRPVNRLDRGTSGAIVLAKSPTAAGIMGKLVQQEGLGKLYLAMVHGTPVAEGIITDALEGKESETRYRVLHQGQEAALVAVTPLTGRMHQIRQHFQMRRTPVLGDRRYGGRAVPGLQGHALHSFRTFFTHPFTGAPVVIHAPLPPSFIAVLRRIAGDNADSLLRSLATAPVTG